MYGRCGRPKTTGKSHNKRANTYSSTRGSELMPKKTKTSNKTIQSFFKISQQEEEQSVVEHPESSNTDIQTIENEEKDDCYESSTTEMNR